MAEDDAGGDADDTFKMLETDATEVELDSDETGLDLESDDTGFGFGLLHLHNHQRVSGSSNHKNT